MRMIIRRISFYLATAIVAISLDFFIPRIIPGNPVDAVLAKMQGATITKATIRSLELQFGSAPRPACGPSTPTTGPRCCTATWASPPATGSSRSAA